MIYCSIKTYIFTYLLTKYWYRHLDSRHFVNIVSISYPGIRNGNENEPLGMGGNGIVKDIPLITSSLNMMGWLDGIGSRHEFSWRKWPAALYSLHTALRGASAILMPFTSDYSAEINRRINPASQRMGMLKTIMEQQRAYSQNESRGTSVMYFLSPPICCRVMDYKGCRW